jgi:L-ribulose-5-phosphate 4-epimerase
MLDSLRAEVYEANMEIMRRGLVLYTFGNASGISRTDGLVVIKASGVPYETMRPEDLVITDLEGRVVEGKLKASSDLPTHLFLYRAFPAVGGVVHTHSRYATAWAQAGREIPCLGTTHADYFHGAVPVTEIMEPHEIESKYEWNTGQVVVRRFAGVDPMSRPGVLVAGHGPFSWGRTPADAAHHSVILEEIACLAYHTVIINSSVRPLCDSLRDKHFSRKHGPKKYYGQE